MKAATILIIHGRGRGITRQELHAILPGRGLQNSVIPAEVDWTKTLYHVGILKELIDWLG